VRRVERAMRICSVRFSPVMLRFLRLYSAVRMIQNHSSPNDCAMIMVFMLHEHLHSQFPDTPTPRLLAKMQELEIALGHAVATQHDHTQ
jgi:hypothetical protein